MNENKKPTKTGEKLVRDEKGRFVKGHITNPKGGRPKGSLDFISQLKSELKKVEKEKGFSLIEHAVRKAYTNPQVLIAMLKKIIPDMAQSNIKVENIGRPYKDLSDDELIIKANEIFNRTVTPGNRRDISRA